MRSSKYLPKIGTFNANKFWDNSFADARAKLLRLADVPEEKISEMVSVKYAQLRYEIEIHTWDKDYHRAKKRADDSS